PMRRWVEELVWVRAQLALGQDITEPLQRLRQEAIDGQVLLWEVKTWILQAMAAGRDADYPQMVKCMSQALRLAQPCGLIRTFIDEGPHLKPILEACTRIPAVAAEARRLLAQFDAPQELHAEHYEEHQQDSKIDLRR